jgi:ribosome-associated toxin RatA of RatAB toxin-antitoxin module
MFKLIKFSGIFYLIRQAFSLSVILIIFQIPPLSKTVSLAQSSIMLTSQEEADLEGGKVIFQGEKGQYIVRVSTTGNIEKAWEVLTDYDNFQEFLPNISDSKIIEENADRTIFEQTNLVDLLLLTKEFTVQIAATKNYPQKIDFEIIEGDLKQLQGSWEVETLPSGKVLVTHRVIVAPKTKGEEAIFYGIYESSLEETLTAIAAEITKRSESDVKNN